MSKKKPNSLKVVVAFLSRKASPERERQFALETMQKVLESTKRQLGSLKAGLGQAVVIVWGGDQRIKAVVDPIKVQADNLYSALDGLEKKLP